MISIEEAKKIVAQEIPKGAPACLPLEEAGQRVLAEDIFSSIDLPLFPASAMDGFAICFEGTNPRSFPVIGLVTAGEIPPRGLKEGEACRVMTGAMVPEGTTAVIPQEEVLQEPRGSILVSRTVQRGENVRVQGEEIRAGDLALPKGTLLTPGAVGFLASLGIPKIPVFAPPRISILPTGSELVRNLADLGPGKIMESNSFCLRAAFEELRISPKILSPVPDVSKLLHAVCEIQLKQNDFLLITGGVSVGVHDVVKEVLESLKVQTLFWRVAQKPGKPLYFGKACNTFVFGLPGNPASSLVCFYEYIRPAVLKWLGFENIEPALEKAKLCHPLKQKGDRTQFLRARAVRKEEGLWVEILGGQESHRMKAFGLANCLAVLPKEIYELQKGEMVTIHWL